MGCCPKSIASRRPFTELASSRDLLRCETPRKGTLEALKLRYRTHKSAEPQNQAFLCDSKLRDVTPLFVLYFER